MTSRLTVTVRRRAATVTVARMGTAGPPGPVGPAGGEGVVHVQSTPAATWTVTHSLGRVPFGSEVLIDDQVVIADVEYPDESTVVVTFAAPQQGSIRII